MTRRSLASVENPPGGAEERPPRASSGGWARDDMPVEDIRASLAAFDEEEWETLFRNPISMPPATPAGLERVEYKVPLHSDPEYSMYYRYELTWGVRKHGRRDGESTRLGAARAQAETDGGECARDIVSCIEFEDPFLYAPNRSYFYRYELRQGLRRT